MHVSLDKMKAIARQEPGDNDDRLLDDAAFRRKTASLEIDVMAADWTDRRLNSGRVVGQSVGSAASSMKKLLGSELGQKVAELSVEALGHYAVPDQRAALGVGANEPPIGPDYATTPVAKYLNGRASTIFGGSSEVQRNVLARVALGL